MKRLLLSCSFTIALLALWAQEPVNPVIGDSSYLAAFGTWPDETTDEQLRIRTHLLHVENRLRTADCSHLTPEAQSARLAAIGLLHAYATRGQFPVNAMYPGERRPCFIDEHGTICAVGYLVEQTAGRGMAETINHRYQYDYIADMQLPQLETWAAQNGLTLRECAMIQPTYYRMDGPLVAQPPYGFYGGYTMAFSGSDALKSAPGFEIGGFLSRHISRRGLIQGSIGYVMRNNKLNASGTASILRNERWSAALLGQYNFRSRNFWMKHFAFKAGMQVDFWDISSPRADYTGTVRYEVSEKRAPELFAVGELCYKLKPYRRFSHSLSAVYMHGLRTTFRGQAVAADGTITSYASAGSYVSLRYQFSVRKKR